MSVTCAPSQQHLNTARSFLARGQSLRAIGSLSELIAADPDSAEAYELLGVAYAMTERRHEARKSFEEAIRRNPRRASAHYNYALMLTGINELDEAADENTTALYLAPHHPGARSLRDVLIHRLRQRAYYREGEDFAGSAVVNSILN